MLVKHYEEKEGIAMIKLNVLWEWIWKLTSVSILITILIIGSINLFVILSAQSRTYTVERLSKSDYKQANIPVIVLGAGVINNKVPSNVLSKRLDTAVAIHQILPKKQFIMSGDHKEDNYNEVAVMKEYLIEHDVPSQQIYLDHAGYSTYDTLYRAKKVLNLNKVIIVTQGYHLSRALLLARSMGLDAIGVPAEEVHSTRSQREIREIGARLKDFAVAYLGYTPRQPELDYGFSLTKSGDLTNEKERMVQVE